MQIQFLGTGGAFDYEYGNSAAWITIGEKKLLLDCGNTVYPKLRETQLADKVDYILITHCHDDHVGSLTTLLLHQTFCVTPSRRPILLYPTPEFGEHLRAYLNFGIMEVDQYVEFAPLSEVEGIQAINTTGEHIEGMPSFGYMFEDESDIIVYSGDTGNPKTIFDAIPKESQKQIRVYHEMTFEHSDGIHVYYKDLIPYLEHYNIYAYHLDPRDELSDNKIPLVHHFPELIFS